MKLPLKIKQKPSNTLRLNFYYLKIICSTQPHYHPKVIGWFLKNEQKYKVRLRKRDYIINDNGNETENEK